MVDKVEFVRKPYEGEPWDVAIIGSGPAGLTAGIYTTRGAASTVIFAGNTWGGQLMLTTIVDNFPGFPKGIEGPDLMKRMREQALRFGAEFIDKDVSSVNFLYENNLHKIIAGGKEYFAKAVIIATGSATRWLDVPGEEKLRGRGVSSCAPCDAPFFKDKSVAVVGGGDSAIEEALVLTKYAGQVTIIHRRDKLRASAVMQKRIFEMKDQGRVDILWDTEVVEMLGESKLEKLRLQTKLNSEQAKKLKEGSAERYRGEIKEESNEYLIWEMPQDGVFVAIGHTPATEIFKGQIDLDEKGYIKKTPSEENFQMATSVEGVFVAGDVHDYTFRQAVTAAGLGCMAAIEALKYLDKSAPSW